MEHAPTEFHSEIGLVGRMIRVFNAPRQTFEAARQGHTWLDWFVPTLIVGIVSLVSVAMIAQIAIESSMKMAEQFTPGGEVTAEQKEMMESLQGASKVMGVIAAPFMSFISLFITALVLLVVARTIGGAVTYGLMLVVAAYASLIGALQLILLTPLMLAKGTVTVHIGLGSFVSDEMMKTFSGRLLAGFDLFTFWEVFVLAIGIAAVSGLDTKKALIPLLVLWVIWILIQAALGGLGAMLTPGT